MLDGNKIRIVVDDRERSTTILSCLRSQNNVEVEIQRLPLGDYSLPNLLVERKTFNDFCTSIKDGRFFRQIGRLANSHVQPLIILEIFASAIIKSPINIKALQGALITASVLYSVPVIKSRSTEETVSLMLQTYDQIKRFGVKMKSWKRPKPQKSQMNTKLKMQLLILQSLPSIGPFRANHLLSKFGNIKAISNSTVEELVTTGGLSESLASKILDLLN